MTHINGFINFNGRCREAMTYYQEILGGDLVLSPIAGSPIENMCPPEIKDHLMHACLKNGSAVVMGTDLTGPGGYIKGNDVALLINCTSEEEINRLYEKLSAGGEIMDPLKEQFWGDTFAAVKDKFGITWMVVLGKNENQQ
ncbi:MAG: VOC family protein [Bacteroidota bacterium]|nr:VOC family protein [Bacteroidota bacterium]